jgi:two-component system cell cycle sensor histidine kinase/response regulator CckA
MDDTFKIELIRGKTISKILGYSERELIGQPLQKFIVQKEYLDEYKTFVIRKKMQETSFDADFICRDGKHFPINFSFTPLIVQEELAGFLTIGRDMSDRKQLEEELRQAQKMESLGTLAGGIAHDFNNILQIMMVNTSSLRRLAPNNEKVTQIIDINTSAIMRGSKLVQQILMFARKSEPHFTPLDMNTVIDEIIKFLSGTFPKNMRFNVEMDTQLPHIFGDSNQLNQVFMNLCVNARDAMDGNGALSFRGTTVMGWELKKRFPAAKEERYICVSVTDTGHGMDEQTRHRIFEPFFTTKELGKGTGLGLAVVHGIITNHKGFIDVKSDIGLGTTFYIYFPVAVDSQRSLDVPTELLTDLPKGTETVLFVEDEKIILQALAAMITAQGYTVLTAEDGLEAVEIFRKMKDKIDLVIMDVGLPNMSGWDVYREMKKDKDNVKVIISSGYLDPAIKSEKILAGIKEFIQKPYDPNQILRSMRKVLDLIDT